MKPWTIYLTQLKRLSRPPASISRLFAPSAMLRMQKRAVNYWEWYEDEQALGRSRGWFETKIHSVVNDFALPGKLPLTPGAADVTEAKSLILGFQLDDVIGDKGYDPKRVVAHVDVQGRRAVIPIRKDATTSRESDWETYKDRNLVVRFWSKIKQIPARGHSAREQRPELSRILQYRVDHASSTLTQPIKTT